MKTYRNIFFLILSSLLVSLNLTLAAQSNGEHWVATWGTAQQLIYNGPTPPRPPQNPPAPINLTVPPIWSSVNNQTVRMIVRASVGGHSVRVRLVNAFGSKPLEIGNAHIALRSKDSTIVSASLRLSVGSVPVKRKLKDCKFSSLSKTPPLPINHFIHISKL